MKKFYHIFKKPPTKHKNKAVVAAALWGIKVGINMMKTFFAKKSRNINLNGKG